MTLYVGRFGPGRCAICGRRLIASEDAPTPDDPRIDLAGDCLWCMYEAEKEAPIEYRTTKPAGWPDDLGPGMPSDDERQSLPEAAARQRRDFFAALEARLRELTPRVAAVLPDEDLRWWTEWLDAGEYGLAIEEVAERLHGGMNATELHRLASDLLAEAERMELRGPALSHLRKHAV